MVELYWLTRLSHLHNLFVSGTGITIAIFIVMLICNIIDNDLDVFGIKKYFWKTVKWLSIPLSISVLGLVFVPTTNEALLIYGVGGTIDYIKANPTAQRLPDKCVEALDKWVDSLSNKEPNEENDN